MVGVNAFFDELGGFDSSVVAFVFGVGEEESEAVAGVDFRAFLCEFSAAMTLLTCCL